MKQLPGICVFAVMSVWLCGVALAVENVPPPEFESDYQLPETITIPARNNALEYVDVAVLVFALAMSVYFVYRKRCRIGVVLLMLFSLIYFGFYRKGCICSIGAVGNVSLSIFDAEYIMPFSALLFFILPLVFTLFFGRTFCGGVCPLGVIQDVVLLRPLKIPGHVESVLRLGAYIYLAAAVWFAAVGSTFLICRYDPFVGFFRRSASFNMLVLGVCFLVVGIFVGRPYCRFFCPYGVILRQLSRLSRRKVTITPDECIKCRLCEDACPFNAIETPTADWSEETRLNDRKVLGMLILILPVLTGIGIFAGAAMSPAASRTHSKVRLADRIYLEDAGEFAETTDASLAFRATGISAEHLYSDAAAVKKRFKIGGYIFGGFVGFVAGVKLILISIHFRRDEYQASRSGCVACARCFSSCPKEHVRLGRIGQGGHEV